MGLSELKTCGRSELASAVAAPEVLSDKAVIEPLQIATDSVQRVTASDFDNSGAVCCSAVCSHCCMVLFCVVQCNAVTVPDPPWLHAKS